VLALNLVAILVVSVIFRVHDLGRLPGVNGDEAYIPVQVARFLQTRDVHSEKVRLRTFSGRPLDVVTVAFFLPALALFEPSFGLLRSYPAAAGLLTVALGYGLVVRPWGRRAAVVAALALATSPMCIATSRMSWEPSLVPLFGVVSIGLAARGRWGWLLAILPLGLSMHPTNLLLVPLLAFLVLARHEPARLGGRALATVGVAALGATAILGAFLLWRFQVRLPVAVWTSPGAWARNALWLGRLISGVTAFRYFVGTPHGSVAAAHDAAFWVLALAVVAGGLPSLIARRQWDRLAVVGWSLAQPWALFLAAGNAALLPPHSRFGMVLVVPILLGGAFLIDARLEDLARSGATRKRVATVAALIALGWVWLGDVQLNYFAPLRRTGGESYAQYRAAGEEPKRQVLRLISRDLAARGRSGADVQIDSFFLFWAVEYLALPRPGLRCEMLAPFGARAAVIQDRAIADVAAGAYLVSWAGAPVERRAVETLGEGRLRSWRVNDAAGRPLISIVRMKVPAEVEVAQRPTADALAR
jgi:hypothetical protein